MAAGTDKRSDERRKVALSTEYRRRQNKIVGTVKNLSQGGMFIQTTKPLPKGSESFFAIQAPGSGVRFNVPGKVIWNMQRAGRKTGRPAGMGIQFQPSRFANPEMLRTILTEILVEVQQ